MTAVAAPGLALFDLDLTLLPIDSDHAWDTFGDSRDLGSRARRRDIRERVNRALAQPPAGDTHQNCDGQGGRGIRPRQPEVYTDQTDQNRE